MADHILGISLGLKLSPNSVLIPRSLLNSQINYSPTQNSQPRRASTRVREGGFGGGGDEGGAPMAVRREAETDGEVEVDNEGGSEVVIMAMASLEDGGALARRSWRTQRMRRRGGGDLR